MKIPLILKVFGLGAVVYFWPWIPLLFFTSTLRSNLFAFILWVVYLFVFAPLIVRRFGRNVRTLRLFPEASKK